MLRLDEQYIRGAIDNRYGGSISRLAASLVLDPPPDRSTVNRWLVSDGSHFPRDEDRIWALAGALDVDPTALWTFDTDTFPNVWPKVRRAARSGKWAGLLSSLSFLRYFTEPADQWPPSPVARRFFGRDWVVEELDHDPRLRANFYRNIVLRSKHKSASPQVWHFASRYSDGAQQREWTPFGFVRRESEMVTLFNDAAITDECATTPNNDEICVQTWHGLGPLAFRIASLHGFTVSTCEEAPDGMPIVRFGFPGEIR